MAKIIQIENEIITIGTDSGGIQEVRKTDCNFEPAIGDEVEIFSTETKVMVIKKEKANTPYYNNDLQSGINISVNNNNNIPPASPIYVSGSKIVNKVTYCVLALLLGSVGAHKFYSGKIGTGLLFLVFCWTYIPLVLSLFDFVFALCKTADGNGNIVV